MKKKLIVRMSNNLGNQMFMYASAYAFAKRLNRELLIDDTSSFSELKNIYKFNLDILNISTKTAPNNLKFAGPIGYLKRKIIKYFDKFNKVKKFYIEAKYDNKNTMFNDDILSYKFNNYLYVEGHFETEKYFKDYTTDIKNEFVIKNSNTYKNTNIFKEIKGSDSVCICIRQNRFSERKRDITKIDDDNSTIFTLDQIKYIKNSINIIKSKISKPKFFLWSNDNKNLSKFFPEKEYFHVSTNKIDLDFFLMSQAKHFIVIPSSFNWWGAWLGNSKESLIIRPSDKHFTNFKLNNRDFWPETWIKF